MRCFVLFSLLGSALCSALCLTAPAADLAPEEVIQKFAAKEAEFRKAREAYTYRQSVKMEELDDSGRAIGKWEVTSDIIFGPKRQREEKVIYAPPISLKNILLSPQDE